MMPVAAWREMLALDLRTGATNDTGTEHFVFRQLGGDGAELIALAGINRRAASITAASSKSLSEIMVANSDLFLLGGK